MQHSRQSAYMATCRIMVKASEFRSHKFHQFDDFRAFAEKNRDIFDGRYIIEAAYLKEPESFHFRGSCGVCCRTTYFHCPQRNGDTSIHGGIKLPNWREQQFCDCESRLNSRMRAFLHFIVDRVGLASWKRILSVGPASPLEARLATESNVDRVGDLSTVTKLYTKTLDRRVGISSKYDLIVSSDYINQVANIVEFLGRVHGLTKPGGTFVFTMPFYIFDESTNTEGKKPRFGWDILSMLRDAHFSDAAVHVYWSKELGYLGTYNVIFEATI